MIEWLNDNSGAVQAVAIGALVVVTAIYATATLWMVREMRHTRQSALRPIVEIEEREIGGLTVGQLLAAAQGKGPPPALECYLRNVGPGPALNVEAKIRDEQNAIVNHFVGVLGPNQPPDFSFFLHLAVVALEDHVHGAVSVRYEDVYGNVWVSEYELLASEDKVAFGPLRVRRLSANR